MELTTNYEISLDLVKNNYVTVRAKQFDKNSRKIIVHCTNNGQEYKLDNNIKAIVQMKKSDGHAIGNNCEINVADNVIIVNLTPQMLAAHGEQETEIVLYNDTLEQVLSTAKFTLLVDPAVINKDDISSSDEFETLVDLIEKNEELFDEFNDLKLDFENQESQRVEAEKGRVSAENQRVEAESNRVSAEQERVQNEEARKSSESQRVQSENNRNSKEQERISSEQERVQSENTRKSEETKRVEAEEIRKSKENERNTAESQRVQNENTRKSEETKRVEAESQRNTNETSRVNAEKERVSSETSRVQAESNRASKENERIEAEKRRVTAESERVSSEEERNSSEQERNSNEEARKTSENERKSKEQERVNAENNRIQKETEREENEGQRVNAENNRNTNEQARVEAESGRQTQEQERVESEEVREQKENERIAEETKRSNAESSRESEENKRKAAESERITAEEERKTAENERKEYFAQAKSDIENALEQTEIKQTQIDSAISIMGDYEIVSEDPTQIRFKKGNGQFGNTVNLGDGLASKSMVNKGGQIFTDNEFHGETSDYGIEIESIKGNFYQEKTNGYQLFDASKLPSKAQGGAYVLNNGDGSFTIGVGSLPNTLEELPIDDGFTNNGNDGSTLEEPPYEVGIDDDFSQMPLANLSENFVHYYNYSHEETLKLLKAGNVTLKNATGTHPYFLVQLKTSNDTASSSTLLQLVDNETKEITQEMLNNPDTFLRIYFFGVSGNNIIAKTIKPMLYQDGDGTWERFTGGKPAPSPEYPLDPKFFEPKEIVSIGKNLLNNKNPLSDSNGTGTPTETGVIVKGNYYCYYKVIVKPNTDYYLSYTKSGSGLNQVSVYNKKPPFANENKIAVFRDLSGGTFNSGNCKELYILFYSASGTQNTSEYSNIMLNIGKTNKEYAPYKGFDTTPSPITLRALPNGVCDTYKNGILSRYVGEITFDGSDDENWTIGDREGKWWQCSYQTNIHKPQSYGLSDKCLFDKTATDSNIWYLLIGNALNILVPKTVSEINSVSTWKAWLSQNPITVWYELKTPTQEYYSLPTVLSYHPYTNSWHDSEVEATEMQWKAKVYDPLEAQDDFVEEDYIKVTETDDMVSTSSHRGGAELLAMDGAYEQVTTNGYQLFDQSKLPTKSEGGVAIVNNGDGSFTISGTSVASTGHYNVYDFSHEETIKLIKKGALTLKTEKVTYPYFTIELRVNNVAKLILFNGKSTSETKEVTEEIINDPSCTLRIAFAGQNSAVKGGTIKPMLYQDGNGDFEPFTGGQPSPSPDYKQEMKAVEVSEIYSIGKNLFDINGEINIRGDNLSKQNVNSAKDNILTTNTNGSTTHGSGQLFTNLKGKSISAKAKCVGVGSGKNAFIGFYENGKQYKTSSTLVANSIWKVQNYIVKTDSFVLGFATMGGTGAQFTDIQIKINDTSDNYTHFNGSSTTPFNLKLRALPSGVCDTYENGVVTRRVGTHKITSIDSIQTGEQNGMKYYVVNVSNKNQNSVNVEGFLVNSIKKINSSEASSNPDIENCIFQNPKNLVIRGTKTDTLETFKEKFLNTEIWYQLETPTYETLDKPFIETYDRWVNIWTDSPVDSHMKIGFKNRFGEFYNRKQIDEMLEESGGGGNPNWDDIQNKPSSFPPSVHTHNKSQISDLSINLTNQDLNTITTIGLYSGNNDNTCANKPGGCTSFGMIVVNSSQNSNRTQMLYDYTNKKCYTRYLINGSPVGSWALIYDTNNKPTPSDIGASPSNHTHDDRYYTESEMNTLLSNKVTKTTLTGKLQASSYRRSIIGLCNANSGANASDQSYAYGKIIFKRNNGLNGIVNVEFTIEEQYTKANTVNVNLIGIEKTNASIKPCTFTYNGKKYGGFDIFIEDAEYNYVFFEGYTSLGTPIALDYKQKEEVLNEEVTNSIDYTKAEYKMNLYYNGATVYTSNVKPTPQDIGASPTNHTHSVASKTASGFMPQLPNETATTKYLRQDGTWQVPPNTTYANFKGATGSANGGSGLVPAPTAGSQGKFLRGDGTWQDVSSGITYENVSASPISNLKPKTPTSVTYYRMTNVQSQLIPDFDSTIFQNILLDGIVFDGEFIIKCYYTRYKDSNNYSIVHEVNFTTYSESKEFVFKFSRHLIYKNGSLSASANGWKQLLPNFVSISYDVKFQDTTTMAISFDRLSKNSGVSFKTTTPIMSVIMYNKNDTNGATKYNAIEFTYNGLGNTFIAKVPSELIRTSETNNVIRMIVTYLPLASSKYDMINDVS